MNSDVVPMYRGDTWYVEVEITQDETPYAPIDLSVWPEIKAQWRDYEDSENFKELEVDRTHADDGIIIVQLAATEVATINCDGVFDIQCKNGDTVYTPAKFRTIIDPDVTRYG